MVISNSFLVHPLKILKPNNYKVTSILKPTEGTLVFSVPMQSFEFEKALMQKHYNSKKFLDTKQLPKGKFKGAITNLSDIDFATDGTYEATVSGTFTIHGVANEITEKFILP